MAAAIEVVTLDRAKTELRLGGDTDESRTDFTEHDALLTGHIRASVAFVEHQTSRAIVERDETVTERRPWEENPVIVGLTDILSILSVSYWTPDAALRAAPDGSIAVNDLGRRAYVKPGSAYYEVWPPAAGWPEVLPNSGGLEIVVRRGMALADVPERWKAAVVLCVRQLYDGYREIRPTEAFFAMIGNTYG